MSIFNLNKAVLGSKIESIAGTAETLANTDFDVRIFDVEISTEVEMHNRKYARGHHGMDAALVGSQSGTVNFSFHLADSGAVATAPNFNKFLKSAGMAETAYTTTGLSWTRGADSDCTTLTLEVRDLDCSGSAQKIYKFSGAMANMKMAYGSSGEPIVVTMEYTGIFGGEAEEASTPLLGTGFDTTIPPNMMGIDITWGANSLRTTTFEFDMGNTVEILRSQGTSTGFLHSMIASSEPSLSMNPKLDLVATDTLRADQLAGTARAISIPVKATTPEITLTVTAGQVISIGRGDAEGSVTREVAFGIVDTDGTSSLEILQGSKT